MNPGTSGPILQSAAHVFTKDPEYYFTYVVFRVGSVIFRVPRHGFEVPGTPFETMFKLPAEISGPEGFRDDNPIVLEQVDEHDFRGFLRVLYPRNPAPSPQDLIGALSLATQWEFDEIRKKAIASLDMHVSSQKAAKTILLAKKCHVASWLRAAYIRLVEEPSLSLSEVQELDLQTQINIYYIRDEIKCRAGTRRVCHPCGITHPRGLTCPLDVHELVKELFKEEFKAMDN